MTIREENIKWINEELETLNEEQLEEVVGGTFTPNRYSKKLYKRAHIEVKSHVFAADEFWWKGQEIGHDNANAVTFFHYKNKRNPSSLEEALRYREEHSFEYHSEIPACFTGESKISTPEGEKFIRDIKVGDEVITLDAQDNKIIGKVIEVRPVVKKEIFNVKFSNGAIWQTTETQWFYSGKNEFACIIGGEGKNAITEDGQISEVIKVTKTAEIQDVYDFVVEGLNMFFVEGVAAEGYSVD